MSPMDVVSASPLIMSATMSSLLHLKLSFVFATGLLLVSQLLRLRISFPSFFGLTSFGISISTNHDCASNIVFSPVRQPFP